MPPVRLDPLPCPCWQGEAQVYNAAAEIGAGFLLIVQLLTPARSILLTFVYWYAAAA